MWEIKFMNVESYIKSNIACNIVNQMLQEEGYEVIALRNNDILDRLAQSGVNRNKISKLLFNIPNFIVIDKKKEAVLLSVKYKGQEKSGRNIDWGFKQIGEYWPNTPILVVSNYKPYFSVLENNSNVEITKSVLKVNKKTSEKYACLVEKFLN